MYIKWSKYAFLNMNSTMCFGFNWKKMPWALGNYMIKYILKVYEYYSLCLWALISEATSKQKNQHLLCFDNGLKSLSLTCVMHGPL